MKKRKLSKEKAYRSAIFYLDKSLNVYIGIYNIKTAIDFKSIAVF